jgi:fructose-1,6-bisphosphatase/inositol monophosphatase family enzyme
MSAPAAKDPPLELLEAVLRIHESIRDAVVTATENQQPGELAGIHRDDEGDTIYAIDVVSERRLLALFEELARDHSFVLIAEGLPGGTVLLPRGSTEQAAAWRIIVDPIDGTRELMYQKRSAWILTGVAPNLGPTTALGDIVLAVQTEVPLVKQHLSDQLWAVRGIGVKAERYDRLSGTRTPLELRPSRCSTIAHGFSMVSRFFPGARDELAAIDEEIVLAALGPVQPGKAHCFEDQYLSSGGQLYELMAGHYRFVADLRPLLQPVLASRGLPLGICCHPYDLCSALIATELGVIVTDASGGRLDAPLSVEANVTWAGYANEQIRRQIEPLLHAALRRRGWL